MIRGFVITTLIAVVLWYLHEYHTAKFMEVTRSIPYLTPLFSKIHLLFSKGSPKTGTFKIYTPEELARYNGEKGSTDVYVSIMGKVFDVTKGKKHYGPGGTYNVFAGRDASRSFITGDFKPEHATDEVLDFSYSELLSLKDWVQFYESEYTYKGVLVGKFYDKTGKKTKYHNDLDEKFNEAEKKKQSDKNEELQFPPCNVEWDANTGSRVWCTKKSGGISRDWVGVPRKLYKTGSSSYRCACIDITQLDNPESVQYARRNQLEIYENCNPNHSSCLFK